MQVHPRITSARIHMHAGNVSGQYQRCGENRVRAAERAAQVHARVLTTSARNNLLLQRRIGQLQQGLPVSAASFFIFPCNPVLYAKFWVYALARLFGLRATWYQSSKARTRERTRAIR